MRLSKTPHQRRREAPPVPHRALGEAERRGTRRCRMTWPTTVGHGPHRVGSWRDGRAYVLVSDARPAFEALALAVARFLSAPPAPS